MQPALLLGSLPYFQQFVLINNFTVSNTFSRSKILGVLIKLIVDGTNMLKTLLLLLVKCTFEEREEFAHYEPTKYIYSSLEPCLMILVNSTQLNRPFGSTGAPLNISPHSCSVNLNKKNNIIINSDTKSNKIHHSFRKNMLIRK